MKSDLIGDSLRKYYKMFGMKNEGPPQDLNVTELFPSMGFQGDIKLIEKICNDSEAIKKFRECFDLIEFIANSISGSNFINEINDTNIQFTKSESKHLSNGIFWHYLASVLNPKVGEKLEVEIPFPSELPVLNQTLLKTQGSLIFRLYMALVYMKEGPIIKILNQSAKNRKPISNKAKKLIQCDYIRHLRNSLAHSTFESTSFGIYFNDYNKFETVASPEFLDSLTTWIMLINLQCSVVIDKKIK
jgi:hypothetical protein